MFIKGYQLYFQVCLLYVYESRTCAAYPQFHYAPSQIETNSFLNRRLRTSLLEQNDLSKRSTADYSHEGNEELSPYTNNEHLYSFPNSLKATTDNYPDMLSMYSQLPLIKGPIGNSNNNKQYIASNTMEMDQEMFSNMDIVYVSNEELLSLFNFYIDKAMSIHHSPVVQHRAISPSSPTSSSNFYASFKFNPSTNLGNLVSNDNALFPQEPGNQSNHRRLTNVTLQPGSWPTFSTSQHQSQTLHQNNELNDNFELGNDDDGHFLEQTDSVGSPSIRNIYKVRDGINYSREESFEFPYKNQYSSSSRKIRWMELANNNSQVPFLENSSTNEIGQSGKEIKESSRLKNVDRIGDALLNLIKNIETKQGRKVERAVNDNHIEIKILGTPQRKIRLRKGRKRQKPFQRGPLIRENIPPNFSSPKNELALWNSFGSYDTFESKKMNPLDSSTKEVQHRAKNESRFQENEVKSSMESQSPKMPRYPKSIKVQDTFNLNPRLQTTNKVNNKIEALNEKYFNEIKVTTEQPTVKRRLTSKKFRKVPKLEFPFPRSFLSGMAFLIKGHENLGPHIIIKEGGGAI